MRKIFIDNKQNDIYYIIRDFYGYAGKIHEGEVTHRLLLAGKPDVDLRCIVFSYSWDHNKELSEQDLKDFDGVNEKTDDYFVKTVNREEIITAIISYVKQWFLNEGEKIIDVEIAGQEEEISAFISIDR